jgi:isopenicillin N synthase-like dioxygenase
MAAELRRACIDIGFFYIRDHGVPKKAIEGLYQASRGFFALDLEDKVEIDIAKSSFNRGYIPLYGEKNNSKSKGDVKETFDMAIEIAADDPDVLAGNPLCGPNQWPSAMPAFKPAMQAYYDEITALSHRLYRAFALALELPEDFFLDRLDKPLDILRILHYPPQPEVLDQDQIGTGAHSDFDCFTILNQDPVGGLQALNSASEWIDAPSIEGSFLINVGDMLERWSNGLFVSTVHRVINRSEKHRYSTVFFAAPNYDTEVACLPSCTSADCPAKYEPVLAGDYIVSRYNEILAEVEGS